MSKSCPLVACVTFLRLNGVNLRPEPNEGVRLMEDIAASVVTEASFASWLRAIAQRTGA